MSPTATRNRGPEIADEVREVMKTICHDVNSSMATIVLCIEFLANQAGEDAPAVVDAYTAIDAVVDRMRKLRELSQQVQVEATGSGVFRT